MELFEEKYGDNKGVLFGEGGDDVIMKYEEEEIPEQEVLTLNQYIHDNSHTFPFVGRYAYKRKKY